MTHKPQHCVQKVRPGKAWGGWEAWPWGAAPGDPAPGRTLGEVSGLPFYRGGRVRLRAECPGEPTATCARPRGLRAVPPCIPPERAMCPGPSPVAEPEERGAGCRRQRGAFRAHHGAGATGQGQEGWGALPQPLRGQLVPTLGRTPRQLTRSARQPPTVTEPGSQSAEAPRAGSMPAPCRLRAGLRVCSVPAPCRLRPGLRAGSVLGSVSGSVSGSVPGQPQFGAQARLAGASEPSLLRAGDPPCLAPWPGTKLSATCQDGQTGALGDARPPHTFLKCHRRDTVGSHSPSPTPPCPDRL